MQPKSVSLRVTSRWRKTRTDANSRRQLKADENGKSLAPCTLRQMWPYSLGLCAFARKDSHPLSQINPLKSTVYSRLRQHCTYLYLGGFHVGGFSTISANTTCKVLNVLLLISRRLITPTPALTPVVP